MKKKVRVSMILYMMLLFVLIGAIIAGADYIWSACEEYQANSAPTLLKQAMADISNFSGLEDIEYDPAPIVDENGESIYTIRSGSEAVARVRLGVKKQGILTLALYELRGMEGIRTFEFFAAEGINVTAKGQPVEPVEKLKYYGTDSLSKFKDDRKIPVYYRYKIDGLYSESQIETACNGHELAAEIEIDGIKYIEKRFSASVASTIKKRARAIAEKYSNFISKDTTWAKLSKEIMNGSQLKTSIPSLEVRWYTVHSSWSVKNVMISEPLCLSDKYALVHISYTYIIDRWGTKNEVPTELALYLHKDSDGVWRLAEMNLNPNYDLEMKPM